jgi:hypothetical protein
MEVATPTGAAQGLPKGGKDTVAVSTPDVSAQGAFSLHVWRKKIYTMKYMHWNEQRRGRNVQIVS